MQLGRGDELPFINRASITTFLAEAIGLEAKIFPSSDF